MPRISSARRLESSRDGAAIVVSKAAVRASQFLGLSNVTLAKVLGVSPATSSRLRDGGHVLGLDSKPYEFALLLVRLFRSLDAMMGGEPSSVRSWMTAPNRALGGVPVELITSVPGFVEVVAYVDGARARI